MTSNLYPVLVLQLPSALQRAGSPFQSWQTHLFSPCRQPWWCVTAGRTLAGAISGGGFIAVGLVTGLGLDISCPSGRCGLDSLDLGLGEPQSWRQGLLQVGLLHSLMFLSLTTESPDRNKTGTWHAPSFSFLYHPESMKLSTRNFLQESWPKGKETHLSLACTPLQSYRLLQALYSCEHREPHTTHCLCIPLWSYRKLKALHSHGWRDLHTLHHPCTPSGASRPMKASHSHGEWELCTTHHLCVRQNKCWDWLIHWLFLLVLCCHFREIFWDHSFLNILGKYWCVTRQTTSLTARTHFMIALGTCPLSIFRNNTPIFHFCSNLPFG